MNQKLLRLLPSVHVLLETPVLTELISEVGQEIVADSVRKYLDNLRSKLMLENAEKIPLAPNQMADQIALEIQQVAKPVFRKVINATGIVLHTNLGRSPMAPSAAKAAHDAACGYLNLEVDIETGKRSTRQDAVRKWICKLLECESATVVNNCAAATIIVLRAVAKGKEVIVSRGQLIEIGGSFRLPEIMEASGAILREVGTTNITHLRDYQNAINQNTAAILRVHPSNYRVHGFHDQPSLADLVKLAKNNGLPMIDDVGSGALFPLSIPGYTEEPNPKTSLQTGADLTLFSGDKLLGGPQSGIIAGTAKWISKIEQDPLMRAFRVDKMTLAALENTLLLHLNKEKAQESIPTLRMLSTPLETLKDRAESFLKMLSEQAKNLCTTRLGKGFAGGGTLPTQEMDSWVVDVFDPSKSTEKIAHTLRTGTPSVFARIENERILLDLRTVPECDLPLLASSLSKAVTI